jgi:hypothetical protein
MPFVEGKSLRQRLARSQQYPVGGDTALRREPLRGWIVRLDWDEWVRITGLSTNRSAHPAL